MNVDWRRYTSVRSCLTEAKVSWEGLSWRVLVSHRFCSLVGAKSWLVIVANESPKNLQMARARLSRPAWVTTRNRCFLTLEQTRKEKKNRQI